MKKSLSLSKAAFPAFILRFPVVVVMFMAILTSGYAQSVIELQGEGPQTRIVKSDHESLELHYSFEALRSFEVKTPAGDFNELILSNGYWVGHQGEPKLPAAKNLIEIPFGASVEVNIKSYTTKEYSLSDYGIHNALIPAQPSLRKDQSPEDVPFEVNQQAYAKSHFAERELAEVEILGVMRGVRIARVTVAPVQYNPSAHSVRVFNNIELEINFPGADTQLTEYIRASTFSPYFESLYSHILNFESSRDIFEDHPDLTKNPIKMLVVSHRDFEETLEPFIEWKTQQGYFLNVAYTDEIGTTASAIQNWIHGEYNAGTPNDPAPTFVVIVGDPGKVPASAVGSSSNQVTDLYYASVDGDYFPEMYLGRLSARNTTELQNQLDKILYYQRYEFDDPSYLDDVTLIAGTDGTWNPAIGQPTVHYGTQNYFNAANGFNNVNAYLNSYAGCYDEERISVSIINFTAHCSSTSWAGPYLTVADVHNMTNTGKYPLAIGNCCQSAQFSVAESIGEAWVRAENKGAVAYVGSAPNTHWFEDFYWAVGAFPISGNNGGYVPTFEETTMGAYDAAFISDYQAVASVKFAGNLAITEANLQGYPVHVSNNSAQYYWQAYQTFGDPSTYIYKTQGSENEVSHMAILPIGMDTYTVEALPGSYVGISKDGVLHGAAMVGPEGEVEVPIEPVMDGGDVTIVVTKSQYIPYIVTVPAAALDGPFVVLDSYEVDLAPGDPGPFTYGLNTTIDVTVKNVGSDDAFDITGTLAGNDPYITLLTTDAVSFGNISAGETGNTATVAEAFTFQVADDVPNQHQATFILSLTDGEDTWESNLRVTALAPVLSFEEMTIEGTLNPGIIDPGDEAQIVIQLTNVGHATTQATEVLATTQSPWLTIQEASVQLDEIFPGQEVQAVFNVIASGATPPETPANVSFTANTGEYSFTEDREIIIGLAPVYDLGDIPTTYNTSVTTASNAMEPGVLTVIIPEGAVITGVDTEYTMTAQGGGWTSEQRSFIRCVSEGGTTESSVASGSGNSAGSYDYHRTGLDIANNVEGGGEIVFEMHAFRTWGGSGSSTQYNYVNNNTWKVIVHYELPGYTVTFEVEDTEGNPISDAEITFDGHTYMPGNYVINNVMSGNYSYSVSKYAYETVSDVVEVDEEDITIQVQLQALPTFEVTFLVMDFYHNDLDDATVTLNGTTYAAGQYTIDNLVAGDYTYEIHKAGFNPTDGEFLLDHEDLNVAVILKQEGYEVIFNVYDMDGEPIEDAAITIQGETHEPGIYHIVGLEGGLHSYSVYREDFREHDGSFMVTGQNVELDVVLVPSGTDISEVVENQIQVFPNPTTGIVNVAFTGHYEAATLRISNYQGQIIETQNLGALRGTQQFQLSLEGYAPGVYYLRIDTHEDVRIKKIVLQ